MHLRYKMYILGPIYVAMSLTMTRPNCVRESGFWLAGDYLTLPRGGAMIKLAVNS